MIARAAFAVRSLAVKGTVRMPRVARYAIFRRSPVVLDRDSLRLVEEVERVGADGDVARVGLEAVLAQQSEEATLGLGARDLDRAFAVEQMREGAGTAAVGVGREAGAERGVVDKALNARFVECAFELVCREHARQVQQGQ
jgi:hypothetical protein